MLSSLAITFAEANRYFNAEISTYFRALNEGNLFAMFVIFALSFSYGVIHAIGPGHGKALVAGYLLAHPTKRSHIFQIGFMIAIIHALSALMVTLLATYLIRVSTMKLFHDVNAPLFQISGGFIILIGCWLLYDVWRSKHQKTESIQQQKSRFGVIVLAGVVPCPGVITLCFFAITLGQISTGIMASFFMSIGMGLTISLAGYIITLVQKNRLIRSQTTWFWLLRLLGAIIVILLGFLLLQTHSHGRII